MELNAILHCGGRNLGLVRLPQKLATNTADIQVLKDCFERAIELAEGHRQLRASTILAERHCSGTISTISSLGVPTIHQVGQVHFDVSASSGTRITVFSHTGFSLIFGAYSLPQLRLVYQGLCAATDAPCIVEGA